MYTAYRTYIRGFFVNAFFHILVFVLTGNLFLTREREKVLELPYIKLSVIISSFKHSFHLSPHAALGSAEEGKCHETFHTF